MHRFYISSKNWPPDTLALTGAEAHHARNVLRLKRGERIVVFNGRGHEITAEITELTRAHIKLRPLHERRSPPPGGHITLAQAIPKGKNMELIVQKSVELGAAEIVPLVSERTVVHLDEAEAARKQVKWQGIAIEAAKQCGQNWLPQIRPPLTARDFFSSDRTTFDLRLIGSLQPDARPLKTVLADVAEHAQPRRVLICIGPEGDFARAELDRARASGYQPISLGPIVLRVETAAIYCLSVLSYELFS